MARKAKARFQKQAKKVLQEAIAESNQYKRKAEKLKAMQKFLKEKTKKMHLPVKKQLLIMVMQTYLTTPGRACELTGIGYEEHLAWKEKFKHYQYELDVVEEMIKDLIEAKFLESAKSGSVMAQREYLFSKAKERGYDKNRTATDDKKISKVEIII